MGHLENRHDLITPHLYAKSLRLKTFTMERASYLARVAAPMLQCIVG